MIHRRRLLLMRHGAVEYFDAFGRPHPPDDVPLTPAGVEQARAMGTGFAAAGLRIDRAVTSGLVRTRETALQVLDAAGLAPEADLRSAFVSAFEGPVPRETRFLHGETIGAMLDRTLPALRKLLANNDWDVALLVLHGGVNRGLLSWFLTGEAVFLGGIAQDTGCLNIVDVGDGPSTSVVRVVNYCALDTLQTATRLSTMEHLLENYLKLRARRSDPGGFA
jgi:broad specificity phosphatase PhoE